MSDKIKDGYTLVMSYTVMTDEKKDSLGEEMSVKEALDLWWNRVDFEYKGKRYFGYKVLNDGDYYIENADTNKSPDAKLKAEILKQKIKLDSGWEIDGDGYPYITGKIIKEQKLIR